MNKIKNVCSFKSIFMLLMLFVSVASFTSCKDDKDDKGAGSNELVGKWYDDEYPNDYVVFNADGSGYSYVVDGRDTYKDYFRYSYSNKNETLTLYWEDDDTEVLEIEWLGKNRIYIEAYGTYTRK